MKSIVISNYFPVDLNEVRMVISDLTGCDWVLEYRNFLLRTVFPPLK